MCTPITRYRVPTQNDMHCSSEDTVYSCERAMTQECQAFVVGLCCVVSTDNNQRTVHRVSQEGQAIGRNCKHRRAAAKPPAYANSLGISGPNFACKSGQWSVLTCLISSGSIYCRLSGQKTPKITISIKFSHFGMLCPSPKSGPQLARDSPITLHYITL